MCCHCVSHSSPACNSCSVLISKICRAAQPQAGQDRTGQEAVQLAWSYRAGKCNKRWQVRDWCLRVPWGMPWVCCSGSRRSNNVGDVVLISACANAVASLGVRTEVQGWVAMQVPCTWDGCCGSSAHGNPATSHHTLGRQVLSCCVVQHGWHRDPLSSCPVVGRTFLWEAAYMAWMVAPTLFPYKTHAALKSAPASCCQLCGF